MRFVHNIRINGRQRPSLIIGVDSLASKDPLLLTIDKIDPTRGYEHGNLMIMQDTIALRKNISRAEKIFRVLDTVGVVHPGDPGDPLGVGL